MKSIFFGKLWANRFVILAVVVFCLMGGIGVYYMVAVDAMNSSLESGWIWFLVASAMFILLHRHVSRRGDQDRPEEKISPDESDDNH